MFKRKDAIGYRLHYEKHGGKSEKLMSRLKRIYVQTSEPDSSQKAVKEVNNVRSKVKRLRSKKHV